MAPFLLDQFYKDRYYIHRRRVYLFYIVLILAATYLYLNHEDLIMEYISSAYDVVHKNAALMFQEMKTVAENLLLSGFDKVRSKTNL